VDDNQIPLGQMEPYPGITAKSKFTLGPVEPDIDHSFVMDSSPSGIPIDTRPRPLQQLAAFYHPDSEIHLEVYSTEPSFQFYTGKFIDVPAVPGQPARGARSGFALEPTRYVNAINNEEWRDMVVLRKGKKYGSRIVYQSWRDRRG
jgi:aldose 1-epimerase